MLAGARDSQAFAAVVVLVGAVVGAPAAVFFWELHAGVWPYVVATSALELAYFLLLAYAYDRAELSVDAARFGMCQYTPEIGFPILLAPCRFRLSQR